MAIYTSEPKSIKEWQINGSKLPDVWNIKLWDDWHFSCDCPSYTYANKHFCKHTQSKRSELEQTYGNIKNYVTLLNEKKI